MLRVKLEIKMLDYAIFAVTFVIFLIFTVIYLYPGSKKTTTIPGPEPVDPLEGNIPDITACESLHEFLVKVHEVYGSIVSFWYGPRMCVSVASPKLFEEQSAVFDRPYELYKGLTLLLGDETAMLASGADGRRRNAVYSKSLTFQSISTNIQILNKLALFVVDCWTSCPKDEYIPVMNHMYQFSIKALLQSQFGLNDVSDGVVKTVIASFDVCWSDTEKFLIGDWMESGSPREKRFLQCKAKLDKLIEDAIKHRKESKIIEERELLIDVVLGLDVPESTKLSDLLTFFIFGVHKTALVLTWAIYFLASNEDIQDKVRTEVSRYFSKGEVKSNLLSNLKFLQQVIQETIRRGVIMPYAARVQDFETVIGGHKIPVGTPVVHAYGVVMNDETIFPNSDSFDPEHFNEENKKQLPSFSFEPFGFAGKRQCPGSQLALTECTLLLAFLLNRFQVKLAPDQVAVHEYGLMTKPKDEVWITASLLQ